MILSEHLLLSKVDFRVKTHISLPFFCRLQADYRVIGLRITSRNAMHLQKHAYNVLPLPCLRPSVLG